jgi:ABC-2 type transport system ATP-binding protein
VNAIELTDITKTYDSGRRALDGLTMAVPAGSLLGFIGLNGAGKTSTIRMLAGLLRPDAGTIRLFGREVQPGDQWHKSLAGFVLDHPMYFPWMTGREYLSFVGHIHGLSEEELERRSDELVAFFDLEDHADEVISSYSTGMGKKISLAGAIIHRPRLLILDEPLEGIDALAAAAIKETLSRITSFGATVLITSHVLETIEKLCTDIALIHRGRVLLQSTTATIHRQAEVLVGDRRFSSLEELFLDLVSDRQKARRLAFLEP